MTFENLPILSDTLVAYFSIPNFNTVEINIRNSDTLNFEFLKNLRNLVKINLTVCKINILKQEFFLSKKLQILILNKISQLIKIEEHFFFQSSILTIHLTNLKINKISNKVFENTRNLRNINFSSTLVKNFESNIFKNLIKLEILDITKSNFKQKRENDYIMSHHLKYLKSLNELHSSNYKYCCFFKIIKQNLKICKPKKFLDTNSCNDIVKTKFLKGKQIKVNV